jgi:hypothetical protein
MSTDKPEPRFKVGQWTRMRGMHSSGKFYAGTVAGAIKSIEWNGREYVYTIQGMGEEEFPEANIVAATEPRGKMEVHPDAVPPKPKKKGAAGK